MKKLILMAIFTCLACNSFAAGWNTNVWPAADHWRFTDTNDYVDISGRAECYQHTLYVTVSSSTPVAEFNASGFEYTGDGYWNTNWFIYPIPIGPARWLYRESKVMFPMYVSTNEITSTILFSSETNNFTSWAILGTNGLAAPTYFSAGRKGGSQTKAHTYTKDGVSRTETIYHTYTNVLLTDSYLVDVKELRSVDTFDALQERADLYTAFGDPPRPAFYRSQNKPNKSASHVDYGTTSERDNLVAFKNYLNTEPWFNMIDSSRFNAQTNLNGFLATNDSLSVVELNTTNILANAGAPTNYLDWTPWRQLNGAGFPYGRIITQDVTIVGVGNSVVTNTVKDYIGNSRSIIGFPNSNVVFYTTNANVQAGFTELDYGWKCMTNIIVQLDYQWDDDSDVDYIVTSGAGSKTSGRSWNKASSNTAWTVAKADVFGSNVTGGVSGWTTAGFVYDTGGATGWNALAERSAVGMGFEYVSKTNAHDVWFYAQCSTNTAVFAGYAYAGYTFNANGFDVSIDQRLNVGRVALSAETNTFNVTTSSTSITPVWCAPEVGLGNYSTEGFFFVDDEDEFIIIKYDLDFE